MRSGRSQTPSSPEDLDETGRDVIGPPVTSFHHRVGGRLSLILGRFIDVQKSTVSVLCQG